MKQLKWIFFSLLLAFAACTDTTEKYNSDWSKEDETFYNKVIALQNKAGENYATWSQTIDSLETIKKLQQFFLDDPSVSTATIGSQGITVQYTNGTKGGVFLNPQDNPGADTLNMRPLLKAYSSNLDRPSLVNIKKAILLNPHYWERSEYANSIVKNYQYWFTQPGFVLQTFYKNEEVTLDRFTELSGHGIVHIYSHGMAYPSEKDIKDVYVLTGEKANVTTTTKYWNHIKPYPPSIPPSIIIMVDARLDEKYQYYWVSEKFIAEHNDFSKDTVLFYGGFCYSLLGGWDQLYTTFAQGAYFGFTWSVDTWNNATWAISLMDSLCNTSTRPPSTPEKWLNETDPPKWYWNSKENKEVHIEYAGDPNLTLWKDSSFNLSGGDGNEKGDYDLNYNLELGCQLKSNLYGLQLYSIDRVKYEIELSYSFDPIKEGVQPISENFKMVFNSIDFNLAPNVSSVKFVAKGEIVNPISDNWYNILIVLKEDKVFITPKGTRIEFGAGNELVLGTTDAVLNFAEVGYFWGELILPSPYYEYFDGMHISIGAMVLQNKN